MPRHNLKGVRPRTLTPKVRYQHLVCVGIITKRIQRFEKKAFKITFDLAQRGSNAWNADRGLGMSNPRGSWMGNVGGNYQQENPYESYYANNSMMGGGYGEANMMGYQVCGSLNDSLV